MKIKWFLINAVASLFATVLIMFANKICDVGVRFLVFFGSWIVFNQLMEDAK